MRVLPVISLIPHTTGRAPAREVVRHATPGADVATTMAVEVPAGRTVVHLSGTLPPAEAGPRGDLRAQTRGVLRALEVALRHIGLDCGDIVRLQVFLAGDAARGTPPDMVGFETAYREFFGTPRQPRLPARTVVQVAGLPEPGCLVEVEATAVRPMLQDPAPA